MHFYKSETMKNAGSDFKNRFIRRELTGYVQECPGKMDFRDFLSESVDFLSCFSLLNDSENVLWEKQKNLRLC